jgi:hypothetical protein
VISSNQKLAKYYGKGGMNFTISRQNYDLKTKVILPSVAKTASRSHNYNKRRGMRSLGLKKKERGIGP